MKWLCLQMLCYDWKLVIWEHFRTWQHNNESRSAAFFGRHDGNGCGFNISCHSHAELAQNFPGISCILSDFHLLLVSWNHSPPSGFATAYQSSILNSNNCVNSTIQIKWVSCTIYLCIVPLHPILSSTMSLCNDSLLDRQNLLLNW